MIRDNTENLLSVEELRLMLVLLVVGHSLREEEDEVEHLIAKILSLISRKQNDDVVELICQQPADHLHALKA